MSDDDIALAVNGLVYRGWKSVRVTQSIESLAGSFALDVSDRWGSAGDLWPIAEGDECRVDIGDQTVISGYVDKRSISANARSRTLAYSGRDKAAVLVDCSALAGKWTYRNVSTEEYVAAIAAPFGVRVRVQDGLALPRIAKVSITPGDSAYDAIRRATADLGVLLVSDAAGGLLITRAGSGRASPLVEGDNILSASVEYDGAERFRRYVVLSQSAATDQASGDATRVQAEATDESIRADRALVLRPEKSGTVEEARRRADWEARIRAARAETVTIAVQGWTQPGGAVWPVNALVRVQARTLIGVDGDMLISQVERTIGDGGKLTQLRLVRPDAFTPEPQAVVRKSTGSGGWKELAKGGL